MVPPDTDPAGSWPGGVSAGSGDGGVVFAVHHRDDDSFPHDHGFAGLALAVDFGAWCGSGAADFAIIGVLALGRALTHAALWHRIWDGVLFVILAFLAYRTDAVQRIAALAAGVVALGVSYALRYRGRFRVAGLIAAGVVIVSGGALLVMSFFAVGPLARLWSERTFDIRQEYWQSAINTMNGLPVFGTGPDGFSRYVAEYRPES